jgi:O-antigen/teichoic acid export membrane protein
LSAPRREAAALLPIAALSALSAALRVLLGLAMTKVLALSVGAAGLALYGQAQNLLSLLAGAAGTGLGNGVTQRVAVQGASDSALRRTLGTALIVAAAASLPVALALALAAPTVAGWLFGDPQSASFVRWAAAALPFAFLGPLPLAALNGQRESLYCVLAPMLANLIGAAACIGLALWLGLPGAVASIACAQLATLAVNAAFFLARNPAFRNPRWISFERETLRALARFALMAVVGGLAMQASVLFVRTTLAHEAGWAEAGHWQALVKLGEVWLAPVMTVLSVYYLPRLAAAFTRSEFRQLLLPALALTLPVVGALALALHAAREPLIRLALSDEFVPAAQWMWLQLLGDVLKVTSHLFALVMWAKGMTRSYLLLEIGFAALNAVLAAHWIPAHGVAGALAATASCYGLYLLLCAATAWWAAPWQARAPETR